MEVSKKNLHILVKRKDFLVYLKQLKISFNIKAISTDAKLTQMNLF